METPLCPLGESVSLTQGQASRDPAPEPLSWKELVLPRGPFTAALAGRLGEVGGHLTDPWVP